MMMDGDTRGRPDMRLAALGLPLGGEMFSDIFAFILIVDLLIIIMGFLFIISVTRRSSEEGIGIDKVGHIGGRAKASELKAKRSGKKGSWMEENSGLVEKRFGAPAGEEGGRYTLTNTRRQITVECPGCGVNLRVATEDRPLTLGCPKCSSVVELAS